MDIYARVVALVGAVTGKLKPLVNLVGSASLTTTAQTVIGAINELKSGKADTANVYTKAQTDSALSGKQNTTDVLDAARIGTGVLDPARIPTISFFKPYASTAATIAGLSTTDQGKISADGRSNTFNAVTLSDGSTYIYVSGSKTDPASYTLISDTTPEWTMVANKPTTVATSGLTDAVSTAQLGTDTDFVALFNSQMA